MVRRDLAELNRQRKFRRGLVKPRNAAEWETVRSGIALCEPGPGVGRTGED
jgi:hypothetical protein